MTPSRPPFRHIEFEVLDGLAPSMKSELHRAFHDRVKILFETKTLVTVAFQGELQELLQVSTTVAAYLVKTFSVPRPKALLGDEVFRQIVRASKEVLRIPNKEGFHGFRISAAGRGSNVFQRIATNLEAGLGLAYDPREGDLSLRIRPSVLRSGEWDVLFRLTPRPLSTRSWRVCNFPGALNATIAAAMVDMLQPNPRDRFCSLMVGSGTLLIERLLRAEADLAVGLDREQGMLECTHRNMNAAGVASSGQLVLGDAARLPFRGSSFNRICADLPWGTLVGSHEENRHLYPAVLTESLRISTEDARLSFLTHEIRLFRDVLKSVPGWEIEKEMRVFQKGHQPRIYLLRRDGASLRSIGAPQRKGSP